jgi:hypothetical protein
MGTVKIPLSAQAQAQAQAQPAVLDQDSRLMLKLDNSLSL